jgi:hypothetical protein
MKHILVILALLAAGTFAVAQSGLTFSTGTEVTALHYNGVWGAANHTTEALDVLDWGAAKGNSLAVEGHQILAPSAGFNSYLGGVRVTPDISSILKPTNISPDQLGVFVQSAFGESTLPSATKFTFFVGGGANYRLTTNLAWSTVDFRIGRVGSQTYYEASSGLVYTFNPQATKAVALKRFLAQRAARARAAAAVQ